LTENRDKDVVADCLEELKSHLGEAASEAAPTLDGIFTIEVQPSAIIESLNFLRDHLEGDFDMLTDLTAVDWMNYPETGERFEVVYLLCSTKSNHRVRVKCRLGETGPRVASATAVFKGAEWLEREVWDLFGIRFDGHPDLRRIMLWEDFEGHPLRKDFPTRGYNPVERTPET